MLAVVSVNVDIPSLYPLLARVNKGSREPFLSLLLILFSTWYQREMSARLSFTSALQLLRPHRAEIDARGVATRVRDAWRQLRIDQTWKRSQPFLGPGLSRPFQSESFDLDRDVLTATLKNPGSREQLEQLVSSMLPWRIGQYNLGGYTIDSEWRSEKKWHRIFPLLPQQQGLKIADVGCSNGYFLFRMAQSLKPELALGFDPINRCWLQCTLLLSMFRLGNTGMLPLGLDALSLFKNFFDLTVCMGVIYHQRDPYEAVRTLVAATKPGGTILLESLVINSDDSVMLIPRERYAKMRNAWMIPSPSALAHLLERAGCSNVSIHRFGPITTAEQRRTLLAPFESLEDFLDPSDNSRTVEGYPAPHSAAVVAVRTR